MHGVQSNAVPRPTYVSPNSTGAAASSSGPDNQGILVTVLTFLGFYIVWAMIERHEKVQGAVQPSNVAVNVRTFFLVALTAIIGINIIKVAVVKLAGFGIPGMSHVAAFVGNA